MIEERIKKLLALAASTTSVNEAEIAFAAAQSLLEKHNILASELENVGKATSEIVRDPNPIFSSGRLPDWKGTLAHQIAELNACMYLRYRTGHRDFEYVLVGRQSDIDYTRYFVTQIIIQLERLAKTHCLLKSGVYRNAWYTGAVSGIVDKLREAKKAARKDASSTALVTYDKRNSLVREFAERELRITYIKATRKSVDAAGFRDGHKVGSEMNTNKQSTLR